MHAAGRSAHKRVVRVVTRAQGHAQGIRANTGLSISHGPTSATHPCARYELYTQ